MRHKIAIRLLLTMATSSIGCAGPADDAVEPEASQTVPEPAVVDEALSYTMELNPGHTLEYKVSNDGAMVLSETGDAETDIPAFEHLNVDFGSPRAVFRALRPGVEIPGEIARIEALIERTRRVGLDADTEPNGWFSARESTQANDKHATSSESHFRSTHFGCFFATSGDVLRGCVPNWNGGDAHAFGSARWGIYKVAPFQGSVRPVVLVNNNVFWFDLVNQGQFKWYWARGNLVKDEFGVQVPTVASHVLLITEAAGDRLHFSARLHNFKYAAASCAETATANPPRGGVPACANHYNQIGDPLPTPIP
jgi:hypothetical protein